MRVVAVLNRRSGTLRRADLGRFRAHLADSFARHGHALDCIVPSGSEELIATIGKLAGDPKIDAIVAGGGDSTASAAAGIAWSHGKALGVLPAGTMNLFARSIGIPLDLDLAAEALAAATVGRVDIATVNERPFVHQASVGLHARAVRLRRFYNYDSRLGKMMASLRAVLASVAQPPVFDVEIEAGDERWSDRVTALSVSNNAYGPGHLPYADGLDGGILGLYTARPLDRRESLKLIADMILGTWHVNPNLAIRRATAITLVFPRLAADARLVVDGELLPLERRLAFRIHPGALKVLLPAPAGPIRR